MFMNQTCILENGTYDAPPPPRSDRCLSKGRRCTLKCLWSPVQVSSCSLREEKNGDASVVDGGGGGQTTKMQYWSDLPSDILFSIASRLGEVDDFIRFMNVCKGWLHSIEPHGGHRNRKPCLLEMEDSDLGWLSLYSISPFHPSSSSSSKTTYKLRIPELKETGFRFSKDGWIMLSKSRFDGPLLFLFNMSTGAKFDLPNLSIPPFFGGVCFTSTPGSSDFMVFAINAVSSSSVTIYTYHPHPSSTSSTDLKKKDYWTIESYENHYRNKTHMDVRFHGVSCNPVFYKGKFYCLDNYGHLGVFDPIRKDWRIVTGRPNNFEDWRKHCMISMQIPSQSSRRSFPYKSFMMVDLKGDHLISVFVYEWKTEKDVHIFRLDSCKMGWEKVNRLGESEQLFVGLSTSISTAQVPHDNQLIYFPGFKTSNDINNNNKGKVAWMYEYESYSLETKEYDEPSSGPVWRDPLKFTWIELPMSKWESIFYSKWESICYNKCKRM